MEKPHISYYPETTGEKGNRRTDATGKTGKLMREDYAQKVVKWKRWATELHEEVSDLVLRRYVWNELVEMIKANSEIQKPSLVHEWLPTVYVRTQAVNIRSIADTDPRVISLGNLLTEIRDNPMIADAHAQDTPIVIDDEDDLIIKREVPDAKLDLERLAAIVEPVRKYVDKRIAHRDKTAARQILRYHEVDIAVDLLGDLAVRYYGFLFNIHYDIEPTIAYDWRAIFRVPWIVPQEATHE